MNPLPVELSGRVIATIAEHQSAAWLAASGVMITPTTSFRELMFDAIDEFQIARRLSAVFEIPFPSSLPWPTDIAGLTTVVERMLRREHTLTLIKDFFSRHWRPAPGLHVISGPALAERVLRLDPKRMLDIGCGYNLLKGKLQSLIGLDIVNPRADIVTDFLRYEREERFDVILVLGSINFGAEQNILDELRHAAEMLSEDGRMFMRVNPGIRWRECPELELYAWSRELIRAHGTAVALEVDGAIEEEMGQNGPRLAFTYRRRSGTASRRLALQYRPSRTRLAWNVGRDRVAASGRRFARAARRIGGSPAPSAAIDFETSKVIWIAFAPAMSGHALARVISASPDVHWDRAVQGIDPLELRSPHDWHPGQDAATCHYVSPLPLPNQRGPGHQFAFTWGGEGRAALRASFDAAPADDVAHAKACFAQPLRFVQVTHVSDREIARVFPNCRRVALIDSDADRFWVRTFHEKLNIRIWPHDLQNRIWRGVAPEQAIAESRLRVPLHDGAPVSFLQISLGLERPGSADIRRYYRQVVDADLARCMAGHTSCSDTIVVDRSLLFSDATWQQEYEKLCWALSIRPMVREVGAFIRSYNAAQWRRAIAQSPTGYAASGCAATDRQSRAPR